MSVKKYPIARFTERITLYGGLYSDKYGQWCKYREVEELLKEKDKIIEQLTQKLNQSNQVAVVWEEI